MGFFQSRANISDSSFLTLYSELLLSMVYKPLCIFLYNLLHVHNRSLFFILFFNDKKQLRKIM